MLPKRALISVSDKTNIIQVAEKLNEYSIELISTGGTAKTLKGAKLPVKEVSDLTAFPEMLNGRVKTLHPNIHAGILANRQEPAHMAALAEHDIAPIDLVIVNLYPFSATVAGGAGFAECIENIDIGGPTMVRAAAKNHAHVGIITSPAQYPELLEALEKGEITSEQRKHWAAAAFSHTATYDATVSHWFNTHNDTPFPQQTALGGTRTQALRYGENPHQQAAVYSTGDGLANAQPLQGKALSYNNLNDADAALALISEFTTPACIILKHTNPCGVALGTNAEDAFNRALTCDNKSAFGGIVAFNQPIDAACAEALTSLFLEVVIAPDFTEDAMTILGKKKNLRVLKLHPAAPTRPLVKSIDGGFLMQQPDTAAVSANQLNYVTTTRPDQEATEQLLFADKICKHVKSNAIVLVKDGMSIGIGAGQMSRIDALECALMKAREMNPGSIKGSVLASDAFFPFPDVVERAVKEGIAAIIQPGGSQGDKQVIAAAEAAGLPMVFTHQRHFKH